MQCFEFVSVIVINYVNGCYIWDMDRGRGPCFTQHWEDKEPIDTVISCLTGGVWMDENEQEHKKFLEQQLEWCREQDRILEEIETKLHEMKKLAQYAFDYELTPLEIDQLNGQMKELESEVHSLEKQLNSVVH